MPSTASQSDAVNVTASPRANTRSQYARQSGGRGTGGAGRRLGQQQLLGQRCRTLPGTHRICVGSQL
jgi:hypothetical protein